MSQYSNEFRSIIKQLRKISANTCAESEQMPYYEKEVCGTLPDVEGQTDQFTLIRVYTRDIDTGQIVLSHYEDTLGNIISGTVVEACCDSAVCGPPFTCAANIVGLSVDMQEGGTILDITGTTMTGYLQWMIDGVVQETFPNPGINTLLIDIASEIIAGGTTISLLVGNNVDMDMYCMFSFETLADMNADLKEVGENPNWNPFPALTAGLGCTGTLTYTLIIDATGNGVTVDYLTGELTLPAGIYDSYAFVEVRCDGVLVAVAGLQLLNEAPVQSEGFELTWKDIANSPFVTHTDLNTFINGNGGAANYTSVVTVGNVQTFYGGTAVDLGNNFMDANASIVSIRDEAFQVVAQGTRGQSSCDLLETIALPALIVQADGCQNSNAVLTSLNLQAMTSQGKSCQSSNTVLLSISLPSLTTQSGSNQNNNKLCTTINLLSLTAQADNNQTDNPSLVSISLPALTTQTSDNQSNNAALTAFTANILTRQTDGNQTGNTVLASITTPLLTGLGTGNYVGCTYNILTINVDASLFGAADILLAQAGGATII